MSGQKPTIGEVTLSSVWNQQQIPVVLRRTGRGEQLRGRLPYAEDNRRWLRNGRRMAPEWIGGAKAYWELPKSWFNDFVDRALLRYGKVYIVQPYREQEICARACQDARGHECQCSCMGAHHGIGNDGGWFEVSDTFSTRWGERKLACRPYEVAGGRSGKRASPKSRVTSGLNLRPPPAIAMCAGAQSRRADKPFAMSEIVRSVRWHSWQGQSGSGPRRRARRPNSHAVHRCD
jgi:hypothetical protein